MNLKADSLNSRTLDHPNVFDVVHQDFWPGLSMQLTMRSQKKTASTCAWGNWKWDQQGEATRTSSASERTGKKNRPFSLHTHAASEYSPPSAKKSC